MRRTNNASTSAPKRAATDIPVRAWVFHTNGDVSALCNKSASTGKLIKQLTPILAATSSSPDACYVEFVTFPRAAGGRWMLVLDESGMYTQPPNVGFAGYMVDIVHAGRYNGAIAVAHVSADDDGDVDLDTVHPLTALPVVADDDDDETLDQFFAVLRRDWHAFVKACRA